MTEWGRVAVVISVSVKYGVLETSHFLSLSPTVDENSGGFYLRAHRGSHEDEFEEHCY